jgi:hypothetical protein
MTAEPTVTGAAVNAIAMLTVVHAHDQPPQ